MTMARVTVAPGACLSRVSLIPEDPDVAALLFAVRRRLEAMFEVDAIVEVGAKGDYWKFNLDHLGFHNPALRPGRGRSNSAYVAVVLWARIEQQLHGPWNHHDDPEPKVVLQTQMLVYGDLLEKGNWFEQNFRKAFAKESRHA